MTMTERGMRTALTTAFLLFLIMSCFSIAWALDEGIDRDPFHPDMNIPGSAASASSDKDWGRDPFSNPLAGRVPVQRQSQNTGKRYLTGIIYSAQVRIAIIGGETLREGAMAGDRKLEKISKRSVLLKNSSGGMEELLLEDFSTGKRATP